MKNFNKIFTAVIMIMGVTSSFATDTNNVCGSYNLPANALATWTPDTQGGTTGTTACQYNSRQGGLVMLPSHYNINQPKGKNWTSQEATDYITKRMVCTPAINSPCEF